MRRNHDDVFVLGEESLSDEATASRVEEEAEARPRPFAAPPSRPVRGQRRTGRGVRVGPRHFAVLGMVGAVVLAVALGSQVVGGGSGGEEPQAESVPAPPVPQVAASPAVESEPATKPAVEPVVRGEEIRAPKVAARKKKRKENFEDRPQGEVEREPIIESAPVSSPVDVPAPEEVPVPPPTPAPSSPPPAPSPPPPGGGGSAVRPEFSFER